MKYALFIAMLLLLSCSSAPFSIPSPMADVPPSPIPELKRCSVTGDADSFTMTCSPLPTPTLEPTPTPKPYFHYFFCHGDSRCAAGQYRVYWDRALTMLRCALPQGSKVTVVTQAMSDRAETGEALAWVITGADAGGKPCEGWAPMAFLQAAY